MVSRKFFSVLLLINLLALVGCAQFVGVGPVSVIDTPSIPNQLNYDGAITLSIKNAQTLPGTTLGYAGKTADGRAIVTVGGQPAPKSTADSVNFTGSPASGAIVTLNTRVTSYDSNAVNLVGRVQITIKDPQPQAGEASANIVTAYGIPVSYTVKVGEKLPGSLIQYLGKSDEGAQFNNVGPFPFRQQFDSLVWDGRLREKIALRLDLRVISFSEDNATLVGTAKVTFEK